MLLIRHFTIVISLILLMFNVSCAKTINENNPSTITKKDSIFYKIYLKLIPEKHFLEANVDLFYYVNKEQIDSLSFLLHKDLSIKSLTCRNLDKYIFDTKISSPFPYSPKAGTLTIFLNKPVNQGELFQINIQYSGKIKRGFFDNLLGINVNNKITQEWTEISLYSPWFPFQPENRNFTYQVSLEIDSDYTVIGTGITRKKGQLWEISEDNSTKDIVIMAAKDIKKKNIRDNDLNLDIYYFALSDSASNDIIENSLFLIKKYLDWFGDIKINHISIVVTPRNEGAGYSRRGMIVLTSFDDDEYYKKRISYFRFIAHEISHLWWTGAPTTSWEDWLNESFAEYSALMAVREKYGENRFSRIVQDKQKKSNILPAIKGIERTSSSAQSVLYDKGCILLFELESNIGKERFIKLLKELKANEVKSTDMFLKILLEQTSVEISKWFEEKLNR